MRPLVYPLPDSFVVALAEYVLDMLGGGVPYLAQCALRAHSENPMLAALVAERGGDPADLQGLFDRGLIEAGIALPEKREAAATVLDQVVRDVATGFVPPELARGRLHQLFVVMTGNGMKPDTAGGLSAALLELRSLVWVACHGDGDYPDALLAVRKACERLVNGDPEGHRSR